MIELAEQIVDFPGLVPGVKGDRFGCVQRVGRRPTARRRSRCEQAAAGIRLHPRHASGKQVGQGCEIGHSRCLATVERILDCITPSTCFHVNEVGHVTRGDAQAQWLALERQVIEELGVRPYRCHCGHLVDHDFGRELAADNRDQRNRRIITGSLIGRRYATGSHQIEAGVRRASAMDHEPAIVAGFSLCELFGLACARCQ